jgi:hypothetical protein
MKIVRLTLALLVAVACAGCGSLLPRSSSDTPSPFATFADAQAAAERIVPFRTRVDDLAALGFDPAQGHNVTLIPYPDIVARLAPYGGVPLDSLDAGVRECILVRSACTAWRFRFERTDRRREGSFWADFLNVRRVTHTTGWWFETLVVVAGGVVLFRNHGGEARIEKVERQVQPLGPLQPAGESVGAILVR